MILQRLRIEQFRNVVRGQEIRFSEAYNVLLGRNGAGKTTLLRLISATLRSDFTEFEREEFAIEFDLVDDDIKITVSAQNRLIQLELSEIPEIGTAPRLRRREDPRFTSSFTIVLAPIDGAAITTIVSRRNGASARAPDEIVTDEKLFGSNLLGRVLYSSTNNPEHLHRAWLNRDAFRFDESLGFFDSIVGSASRSPLAPQLTIYLQTATERNEPDSQAPISMMQFRNLPTGPLDWVLRESSTETNFDEDFMVPHKGAPFLAWFIETAGFVSAQMKIQFVGKSQEEDRETFLYGPVHFLFERKDGRVVSHDRLSYGQKRLLAFFYYLDLNSATAIADELVNGLHHSWIASALSLAHGRQLFLTSQNPLLLDHLDFASEADVGASFVTCAIVDRADSEQMSWSNIGKQDADGFYASYKTGFLHVGEILRNRGLW